jgi:hypothetical protein
MKDKRQELKQLYKQLAYFISIEHPEIWAWIKTKLEEFQHIEEELWCKQ